METECISGKIVNMKENLRKTLWKEQQKSDTPKKNTMKDG
jgi:hypothetical protein